MKHFIQQALYMLIASLLLITACTKSTPIGSELITQDQLELKFTDDFNIIARSINIDSVKTYGPKDNEQLNSYLCGRYEDPVFGKVEASIFTQVSLDGGSLPDFITKEGAVVLDSAILSLVYDSTKVYGDEFALPQNISVYKLSSSLDRAETYYSNQTFEFKPIVIGQKSFFPRVKDSVTVIEYNQFRPDTNKLLPQVRIPLTSAFANTLLNFDKSVYENLELFREKFQGIHITASEDSKAMLGYVLFSNESRITLYFSVDGIKGEYRLPFTFQSAKMNHFVNDYTGKDITEFFDDPAKGDSLIFIQGMSGVKAKMELTDVSKLENVIINKATLEFYIATPSTSIFDPTRRIFLFNEDEEGNLFSVSDLAIATRLAAIDFFGGKPITDEQVSVQKYQMVVTSYLQSVADGTEDRPLIILPQLNLERAERVVIFGPGHSTYPMKLSVTYTQL